MGQHVADSKGMLAPLMLDECAARVAVAFGPTRYEAAPPYSPGMPYPEYPFAAATCAPANEVYATVRESLRLVGLDAARFGTSAWNPLACVVRPGDTVVLKPNFVRDFRETRDAHDDCLITHGAILRAVADYVFKALGGTGRIVIADAPQNDADFDGIRRITHVDAIRAFYREHADFDIELYDLRPEAADKVDGVIVGHRRLPGDPAGYTRVNLGLRSMFAEVNHLCHRLYGSEYDTSELCSHQHDDVHEYLIARTILEADVVISVPKLKTHKKTGITVNLKNLVGINGNKNWLPHHREGTPSQGGDQFCDNAVKRRIERTTVAQFKRVFPLLGPLRPLIAGPVKAFGRRVFGDTNTDTVRSGNWYGNDTTWRMVLDLNRILFYADADGRVHEHPVRRLFSIVDGIIGGEGNGPLDPVAKQSGIVVAGFNPVAVDFACARLMGFDFQSLPVLYRALSAHPLPLARFAADDVTCASNRGDCEGRVVDLEGPMLGYVPHFGWKGHIEWQSAGESAVASVGRSV